MNYGKIVLFTIIGIMAIGGLIQAYTVVKQPVTIEATIVRNSNSSLSNESSGVEITTSHKRSAITYILTNQNGSNIIFQAPAACAQGCSYANTLTSLNLPANFLKNQSGPAIITVVYQ